MVELTKYEFVELFAKLSLAEKIKICRRILVREKIFLDKIKFKKKELVTIESSGS